ncbi:hypothetical protein [Mycetohabitans endofungorum]|uniref:hypothetical protein n=1 Tax=Mycetohabitans endofungorum TaxID=417203 RepID=UPI002B05E38F|nr:hypothetical protein [Mycetohabitans endofungorum]
MKRKQLCVSLSVACATVIATNLAFAISTPQEAAGQTGVTCTYDPLKQLETRTVTNPLNTSQFLKMTVTRVSAETGLLRTLIDQNNNTLLEVRDSFVQDIQYSIHSRITTQAGTTLRKEQYTISNLSGLLDNYAISGTMLPVDQYGQSLTAQKLTYNPLYYIDQCITTFVSGNGTAVDTATFHYDNEDNPVQLTRVTHTATDAGYPATVTVPQEDNDDRLDLTYLKNALQGQDALSRLIKIVESDECKSPSYDELNALVPRIVAGDTR